MAEHGTITRRMKHVKDGDRPEDCLPCTEAGNRYQRERRRDPTLTKRLTCPVCGRGMNRQRDKDGNLVVTREVCYTCKRNHGKKPPCGTVGGYAWHWFVQKEKPCDPCREAYNYKRSGFKPKKCLTEGCKRRVYLRDKVHCAVCRRGTVIGWQNLRGIKVPVYPAIKAKKDRGALASRNSG